MIMYNALILIAAYVAVMIMVGGFIGGIRDEMDGIGDMAIVLFWPIWLSCKIIALVFRILFSVGRGFNK